MSLHATFHLLIRIYLLFLCLWRRLSRILLHSERTMEWPEKSEIRFMNVQCEWMCVAPIKKPTMKCWGDKVHLHLRNYQINYARHSCDLLPFRSRIQWTSQAGIGAYMWKRERSFVCPCFSGGTWAKKKKQTRWWMRYEREPSIGVSVNWR